MASNRSFNPPATTLNTAVATVTTAVAPPVEAISANEYFDASIDGEEAEDPGISDVDLPLATEPKQDGEVESSATGNLTQARILAAADWLQRADRNGYTVQFIYDEIENLVYSLTGELEGSISAEHGIGFSKRAYLNQSRNPQEIATMQRLKRAFDPNNILNPGRIFEMP